MKKISQKYLAHWITLFLVPFLSISTIFALGICNKIISTWECTNICGRIKHPFSGTNPSYSCKAFETPCVWMGESLKKSVIELPQFLSSIFLAPIENHLRVWHKMSVRSLWFSWGIFEATFWICYLKQFQNNIMKLFGENYVSFQGSLIGNDLWIKLVIYPNFRK